MNLKKYLRPRHEPEYDEPVWLGLSRSSWGTWAILSAIVFLFFILGVLGFLGKMEFGIMLIFMLLALVAIAATAALADVKVLIDSKGIHIRCGAFSYPKRTIAWSEVKSIKAIKVEPAKIGAVGFRWYSLKDGTAIVMRKGPGLEIKEKNGRRYVVTVDEATKGASFAQQFVGEKAKAS